MSSTPEEVADFIADRAREDPKVRRVIEDVKMFDGLLEHVGWQRLAQIVRAERDRFLASFAQRLWSGKEVDPAELAYFRGFYAGAEWIIKTPEEAEASLETAARKAWSLARIEAATEVEGASPYLDEPQGGD